MSPAQYGWSHVHRGARVPASLIHAAKGAAVAPSSAAVGPTPHTPPFGYVTVACHMLGESFTVLLGDGPPQRTDGYQGWTEVQRSRQDAGIEWAGSTTGRRLVVPVLFDGWKANRSVEAACLKLERMTEPVRWPGGIVQPPTVRVAGAVPHVDWTFVIGDLAWGPALRDERTHSRLRQGVTVTFLRYAPFDLVAANGSAAKAREKIKPHKKTYRVKQGDDLSKIAARVLGHGNLWREIAARNGIRDPKAIHAGEILKLP